jgi:hypothetical protein
MCEQRKSENQAIIERCNQVDEELNEIRADYEQNKRQVVKMLLDQILIVNIEVPKVVQQKFE